MPRSPESGSRDSEDLNIEDKEHEDGQIKEQKVAVMERQKEIIIKVAEEMGLDIKFQPSEELKPPVIDVIFESSDKKMGEFINRVREFGVY
jgi:hypothetical protein